ncbi:MAG: hypothetical protein LQ349_002211 [Xanthoria aureola]|nr:MAG: hypothetical protein LQ349_002211 [Xanthoria aureola]
MNRITYGYGQPPLPVCKRLTSDDYTLTIRQGPERARVADKKEKERKPVDPPPIVQLHIRDPTDPAQNYLQSPYLFMYVNLEPGSDDDAAKLDTQDYLSGTMVSSLHRLKDVDNLDGGFFVFGDLSVKVEGHFRLRFSLFEMLKTEVVFIKAITSSPFKVYPGKAFPGMSESTFLSRSFGDQGVRLRIRKEPRSVLKRPASMGTRADEFASAVGETTSCTSQIHNRVTSQSQRPQVGTYGGQHAREDEPSHKRQRTSVDLGGRNGYEAERHHLGRPYYDPRAPLGIYNTREQAANSFNPIYGQAPQSAFSSGSDITFGHHRTTSSNTSSPYTSPHAEFPGQPWPPANSYFQPSPRESMYTNASTVYSDMHLNRQYQLTDVAPRYRSRLPGHQAFTVPRAQESDSSTTAYYSSMGRSHALPPHYEESSLRLPPTDHVGDMTASNRQQYPNNTLPHILPPLESTVGSTQSRAVNIMPSIETQDGHPVSSQSTRQRATESYDYNADQ